jgi:ElaB/YqjD/DUF883 family membrane-anchored ribosome-binding protein
MDSTAEPIRQDIDNIRASMTEKMEQIENKIKGTVDDTTHSVKRMVDVRHQAGEHPWAALSISVLVGYWLGSMGNGSSENRRYGDSGFRSYPSNAPDAYAQSRYASNAHESAPSYNQSGYSSNYSSYNPSASYSSNYSSYNPSGSYTSSYSPSDTYGSNAPSYSPSGTYGSSASSYTPSTGYSAGSGSSGSWQQESRHASKPGVLDSVTSQFSDEIEALKSAAVTSLVGLLRDTIRQNFPSMHQEMERVRGEQGYSSGGSQYRGDQYGSGSQHGSQYSSQYGSGTTGASGQAGASGADYARSAANNPPHLGGTASEPSRTPPERDSDPTARNR